MGILRVNEDELVTLAQSGGALIDQLILEVCANNYSELKEQSTLYVSGAVWGILKNGALDQVQKRINKIVEPIVTKWLEMIDVEGLKPEQKFAIQYAIRGWILSRILYTIVVANEFEAENPDKCSNPLEMQRLH